MYDQNLKSAMEKPCATCGVLFEVRDKRPGRSKCCSWACRNTLLSKRYTGLKRNDEWKSNLSKSKMGEKHPLWKGDKAGYKSIHQWVVRMLGRADECAECNSTEYVEWANKSHKYMRDLTDWIKLCKKCHKKYDRNNMGIASKVFVKSAGGLGVRI